MIISTGKIGNNWNFKVFQVIELLVWSSGGAK